MTQDLPVALWLDAHLKRLTIEGLPYYIAHRGDYASGIILLKINLLDSTCLVLQQQRDINGKLGWVALFKGAKTPETEADAFIARSIDRDPDLWAVEIEDREGRNPFDDK